MKSAYARMLIALEEGKGRFSPLVSHFCKYAIEERIVSVMKIGKVSFVKIVLAVMLIAGTTVAFATSALPSEKNNPSASSGTMNSQDIQANESERASLIEEDSAESSNFAGDLSYCEDSANKLEFWEIDEFEAWMEQELIKNQILADSGDMSFYEKNADGYYECRAWRQEDVDALYAQWEEQLEKMKLGYRYTKDIEVLGGGMAGVFVPEGFDGH